MTKPPLPSFRVDALNGVAGRAGESVAVEASGRPANPDSSLQPRRAMGLWQLSQWRANSMPLVRSRMLTLVR